MVKWFYASPHLCCRLWVPRDANLHIHKFHTYKQRSQPTYRRLGKIHWWVLCINAAILYVGWHLCLKSTGISLQVLTMRFDFWVWISIGSIIVNLVSLSLMGVLLTTESLGSQSYLVCISCETEGSKRRNFMDLHT
jgi:hypothetical protein